MRRTGVLAAMLAMTVMAGGAEAQRFSEGYRFLEAIRKADGAEVTKILNNPATRIIDTRSDAGEGALHIVVKRSDATYLGFLLAKGADPNIRDGQGETPMMTALLGGFVPGVELLLKRGGNVNLGNSRGETPLIRAVQLRNPEAVRLLLANGADPDQTDNVAGMSARDYARVDTRSPAVAKMMAEAPKVGPKKGVSGPKL